MQLTLFICACMIILKYFFHPPRTFKEKIMNTDGKIIYFFELNLSGLNQHVKHLHNCQFRLQNFQFSEHNSWKLEGILLLSLWPSQKEKLWPIRLGGCLVFFYYILFYAFGLFLTLSLVVFFFQVMHSFKHIRDCRMLSFSNRYHNVYV